VAFDRRDIANTVKKLYDNGAMMVVAPILFRKKTELVMMKNSLNSLKIVLPQVTTTQNSKPDSVQSWVFCYWQVDPITSVYRWPGGLRLLTRYASAPAGVGVVATVPEVDGVVRRIPLVVSIANNLYPSLALESIRVAAGDPSYPN
jgi:adenylate cyclase